MKVSTRKISITSLAAVGIVSLLAACGSPPPSSGTGGKAASSFLPCMVSDGGGFDDKAFNQLGYNGLKTAAEKLGARPSTVESKSESDFAPNLTNLVGQNCGIIVTVGFLLADATKASATANPKTKFATIDDNSITLDNVKPIVYDTAQAAFLAGYAAASFSKSGHVGTFGALQIPTVTVFMDGFAQGVDFFNKKKGKSVKLDGWDSAAQKGSFTGGFDAGVEAKAAAQSLIDQKADVIMPVGGPIFQSAGQAIRDSGKEIALIGVDSDNYETAPDLKDLFLTTVEKDVSVSVADVVGAAADGTFDNKPYIGTLKNSGVGISSFHDFESKVSPDLKSELATIKAGIIDGSIPVTSVSSPK